MGYTPRVVVIGGGSTGTGVARDLAMRGLEVTLLERGRLGGGSAGSTTGLLHSGARFAVDDPETAAACRGESGILREIAAPYVRETGGLVVSGPDDPSGYREEAMAACAEVDVATTPLSGEELRDREPALSDDVDAGFAVPDAVVDAVGLCVANARSALRHGAEVRTNATVAGIQLEDGAVDRLLVRTDDPGRTEGTGGGLDVFSPDYVVNAAGPWVGEVARKAELSVDARYATGGIVVTENAGHVRVLTRCRPADEGDVAVPVGSTSVLGTTLRRVDGPQDDEVRPAELDGLVDELATVLPGVADARPYRAEAGVTALVPEVDDGPPVGRWTLLDHEARDGVWGISTVFGGTVTTHRLIASEVADHVCRKFGIDRACPTAGHRLPAPVADGPEPRPGDPVLCECEEVPRSAVRAVLDDEELPPGPDLVAVAGRTGAATGACQGGRCAHRLAAELSPGEPTGVVDRALEDLRIERWDGVRPVLYGEGLASAAETHERTEMALRGATTDPALHGSLDWSAFDAGPDGEASAGGDGGEE